MEIMLYKSLFLQRHDNVFFFKDDHIYLFFDIFIDRLILLNQVE